METRYVDETIYTHAHSGVCVPHYGDQLLAITQGCDQPVTVGGRPLAEITKLFWNEVPRPATIRCACTENNTMTPIGITYRFWSLNVHDRYYECQSRGVKFEFPDIATCFHGPYAKKTASGNQAGGN
jgi:hypothetical protein